MVRAASLTYDRARSILLLSGLILIGLVGLISLARGVDTVEVSATLFFIPVFAGFVFFGTRGGLAVASLASLGYLALRVPSIRLIGWTPLAGQIFARILGYLGFGFGGGWAFQQIRATLEKMELHDDVDDDTGLGNARSMLETVDVEKARADRYQKVFSVVLADLTSPSWTTLPNRRQRLALRALGAKLEAAKRSSDHAAHARQGDHHLIALVLPETGPEGARIVAENLQRQLSHDGATSKTRLATATYPGDGEALSAILRLFREIERAQRPSTKDSPPAAQ
ncbi:MAG: hypothetical protein ACT4OP_12790 [Actinomycetota bacterium]